MGMMGAPQQQMQPVNHLILPKVNLSELDALIGDDRNDFVGNNIYEPILKTYGEALAPRITGMLLDEENINFKSLLSDNNYFSTKV